MQLHIKLQSNLYNHDTEFVLNIIYRIIKMVCNVLIFACEEITDVALSYVYVLVIGQVKTWYVRVLYY